MTKIMYGKCAETTALIRFKQLIFNIINTKKRGKHSVIFFD